MNTSYEIIKELERRFPKSMKKFYDFTGHVMSDMWEILKYIESNMGCEPLLYVLNRYSDDAYIVFNDCNCMTPIFNTESLKEAIIEWFQIQEENTK